MGLRGKVIAFTVGVVAILTGLSLLVVRASVENRVHDELARQLTQTRGVFENFMSDRSSWLRSQCIVVAEDPRFTATIDIMSPDLAYQERTVKREAGRFQHIIGGDLFTVYGAGGRVLTNLEIVSVMDADPEGLPSIQSALSGTGASGLWEEKSLNVTSVPIVDVGKTVGTFTVGYKDPVDSAALMTDMEGVTKGSQLADALMRGRDAQAATARMLRAFACDLVMLTDGDGAVVGSTYRRFSSGEISKDPYVEAALMGRETAGLRVVGERLVQICVIPVLSGDDIIGALETGFYVDREVAYGLRDLMQTEVSFVLGGRILATTWSDETRELTDLAKTAELDEVTEVLVGGERYLSLMRSLPGEDQNFTGAYLIQLSVDEATSFLSTLNVSLVVIGGVVLILASLMSAFGVSRIVQPIIALSEATKDLAREGESRPIPVRSRDEVGDLAASFNEMTSALTESRAALTASERLYRDLFEGAQDVVYTTDLSLNLISMNRVGLDLFGLRRYEMGGRSLSSLVHEDDADRLREAERVVKPGGYRPVVEFRVERPDGVLTSLEVTTRWLIEGGRPVGIHAIGRDVSARREREEATSRFREQLHQAEKLKALGEMAAGVAHNFNNLLTGVMGYAEVVKMQADLPERSVGHVDKIVESAKRCAAVIRRIQGFGRPLETSQTVPININQVIRETVDITRPRWKTAPETEGRKIDVILDLEDVGNVVGAEAVWEEILSNLIFNASDAMPEGGEITISTRIEDGRICIAVADTGIGMDEETRRRVFEPFFTTKGPEYGTGLGLSTVWSLTKAQNGRVRVESTPGQGTTIFLSTLRATSEETAAEAGLSDLPEGLVILAVDDEPAARDLIPALLEEHNVRVAEDGESALLLLEAHPCDVVITDWVMSEMSGIELGERIKDRWPDTRVLLMTGWEFDQATVPGAGCVDGVLSKPFDVQKIKEALRRVLVEEETSAQI